MKSPLFLLLAVGLNSPVCTPAFDSTNAPGWVAKRDAEWHEITSPSTYVVPGSALDLSRFIEAPAGKYGRVMLNDTGRLVFEKRPDRRVIFFGCSIAPHEVLGQWCTTKEAIRQWAEAVRRQGYNLVRPHFLDHYLTGTSTTDLEFDPEALDRFDYLVACLKENGIYLYLDAMTSWRGYNAGPGWAPEAHKTAFKGRIYFDDTVRAHWRAGVRTLLQHENPYTKTRLADDPVVAVMLFFNEQNLNFYRQLDDRFTAPWHAWLKKEYGTTEAFRAAWTNAAGKSLVPAGVTLDSVPLFEPRHVWDADQRGRDVGLFVYDIHAELLDWFTKTTRELGYNGLVTHYDWLYHLGIQALRNRVPVISMHNYHAHPSDFSSKGSTISQESAVATENRLFCLMASTRYGNRPLLITEYGEVFWNRYRYEEGLLVGAYGAFQDWDGLMAHASPVVPQIRGAIHPFWVGHDPVGRASQVVAGFAYLRRDVSPSPHYVEILLQRGHIFDAAQHAKALSTDQARLALLTGIGLAYPGEALPPGLHPRKADLRLPVFGTSETLVKELFSDVLETKDGKKPLANALEALKRVGIISPTNRTDIGRGVFECDTGQLLLNAPARQIRVTTPRLQGACFDPAAKNLDSSLALTPSQPIPLGQLTIENSSVPAAVTAIAVDDKPLVESRRVLLVYATDALNSGMSFTSRTRETLVALGKVPVLLRSGQLEISLTGQHVAGMKAWALGLDGRRAEPVSVSATGQKLSLSIDTASLKTPTPFFELVAE
jgi:hypothetical protein